MTTAADFETIDAQIEVLQARLEGCRKAMVVSRAVAAAALLTIGLALTLVTALRTPEIVFTAIAAAIGATVWLGASRTSAAEAEAQLDALDRSKARLIDEVARRNGWRDLTPTVH